MMNIQLGALLFANEVTCDNLERLKEAGFETLSICFWETLGKIDFKDLARCTSEAGLPVTAISIWGNPLANEETLRGVQTLIEQAYRFGDPFVSTFAGRIPSGSVEATLPRFKEVFSELIDQVYRHDCRGLLLENCRMGDLWKRGSWNIAINDAAWELIFSTLDDPLLGLEWEPCHQVESLLEPLAQLRRWKGRVLHVHGKDAHVDHALLSEIGLYAPEKAIKATLPGCGDTDWQALMQILVDGGYQGSIEIEAGGTSFFTDFKEKVASLGYLKKCRNNLR
ncbi:MAG: sugar phosphate isomerase/epimerase [Sphaerochaetaceae bacterium]|nr:sugar phosphate isomerase/epimerase [Sphaerochaetaceae bacterium]